jgi:PAS domain S-box-containing protein
MTPDLVCIAGKDGYFKKINRAVVEKLGYTEEELMAKPISSFWHPEDREHTLHKRSEMLKGTALLNFQNRYITKKGIVLWFEWTSIYFEESEVVFAIAKDITERKQVEQEVEEEYRKFKSLASHFKSSMEADRKYLAKELHEELAQLASVLRMDLEGIRTEAIDELPPAAKGRIEHAAAISQQLIKTIRRLSFSISPNMLEHLGLNATLEWYCREFTILTGVPCHFEGSHDEIALNDEIRVDLFRICQESLMNALNHAQAAHVTVRIEDCGDQIRLSIIDDGNGFDVKKQSKHPGLTRMRRRASSINGELTIHSGIGEGTTISLTIAKRPAGL